MITLQEELIVGEGCKRICYLHPSDPSKIIKVKNQYYKKSGNFNQAEYDAFLRAQKRYGDKIQSFLPHYYGYVETNLGQGLVADNMMLHVDGVFSDQNRLDKFLSAEDFDFSKFIQILKQFLQMIRQENILIRDPMLMNFSVKDQKIYNIDIDGFDCRSPEKKLLFFLPKSYFVNRSLRKLKRRIIKLLASKVTFEELQTLENI